MEATKCKHENTEQHCNESAYHTNPICFKDFAEDFKIALVGVVRIVAQLMVVNHHVGNAHCREENDCQC